MLNPEEPPAVQTGSVPVLFWAGEVKMCEDQTVALLEPF